MNRGDDPNPVSPCAWSASRSSGVPFAGDNWFDHQATLTNFVHFCRNGELSRCEVAHCEIGDLTPERNPPLLGIRNDQNWLEAIPNATCENDRRPTVLRSLPAQNIDSVPSWSFPLSVQHSAYEPDGAHQRIDPTWRKPSERPIRQIAHVRRYPSVNRHMFCRRVIPPSVPHPTSRRSCMTLSISSSVSPRPSMIPVLLTTSGHS